MRFAKIEVLIFSGYYLPGFRGGGPIRTIANMVEKLGDEFNFGIYTSDRDLGDVVAYNSIVPNSWQVVGKANVYYAAPGIGWIFRLLKIVFAFDGSLVHLNSFFAFRYSILPLLFFRTLRPDVRVILGPRGEFSEGALRLKSFKKKLFIWIFKNSWINKGIIWHASSGFEAVDIRRVMGQGVKIHEAIDIANPKIEFVLRSRSVGVPLRVVFISRISPMKNLLGAIVALNKVGCNVDFDIYGPVEDSKYWSVCQNSLISLPANIATRYCGELHPNHVVDKLSEYDLFLLPTLGENYGHVIAEALSAGLPVLISDATPWRNLQVKNLGWDLPLDDIFKFSSCVEACAVLSPDAYYRWRQSIRLWALNNIGGHEAIEQNRQLFMYRDL